MIDVYITHHLMRDTANALGLNDFLLDEITWIRRATQRTDYRLTVVYSDTESLAAVTDLSERVPKDVHLVRNDRQDYTSQPSMRNKVVELAKSSGCDFAVLLHNDVRPAHGWLDRFVQDIEHVEGVYGKGSTIVSPRHVPYYYLDPPPSIVKSPTFWAYLKATHIPSVEKMAAYCLEHGLLFDGDKVTCIPWQPPANTGHQLMMWIARPEFFDAVGLCDEEMRGINFDDSDWGIRALLANKRNLQSCTALIGHVEGLTFFNPKYTQAPVDNAQVFIKKWGREMFDEMQTGTLWVRLHKEQDERRR